MKRTKELRSCVSFKRNWPLNLRIFFSHNSPSLCWTDMVFCKRIELSITDRESYDIWTNLFAQYWFRKSKPVFARCINRLGVGEERGRGWGRVLKGILDRGVPPWPSNPDLVSEKNPSFCYHVYDIRLTIMILIHFFLHTELSNFLD